MASPRPRLVCLVLGVVAVTAACGAAPTAPAPQPPASPVLPSGRYLLTASVNALGSRDYRCAGTIESWGFFGPLVGAPIQLTRDGDAWSGRAESAADGDLELRFQRTSASGSDTEVTVSGTVTGTIFHFLDVLTPSGRRAARFGAGASATVEGLASLSLSGGFLGSAGGSVTFTDRLGTPTACETVDVLLSPLR
jgi:hypothetical protein